MTAAHHLADAIDAITGNSGPDARDVGLRRLSRLASFGVPFLKPQADGSLRQQWTGGSLLSTMAVMVMEDLSKNLLHQCTTCRSFFLSGAYQAEYCSTTCRHTMQKRRYRQRTQKKSRRDRRQR